MNIHQTAIVHEHAQIGANVTVGPFAVIGEHVILGDQCEVGAHVVLDGHTEIGEGCKFFTGAVIGSPPQDLKYAGEPTRLVIGNQSVFREYSTVNIGTTQGGGITTVGNNCLFMAYAHAGHDCHIGNNVILANSVGLSGHVTIEDFAIVGGLCGVHQFVRVGAHCIIGGCSGISQDVPPYVMVSGQRAEVFGLNSVGLKRRNFPEASIKALEKAHRILFRGKVNLKHALERIKNEVPSCPEIEHLLDFITHSERGICRGVSS
ncbi:acyl-[acyl-carrier-protein]--UDP-N-acetylglucosamine O-acyltransferase [Candidatus Moduliflexus flocculans]|uniref:Acyl-[acyl-carrier-protein]--UDP-N-acetylglucosamine O-acyltransferase n=1 Tax=Candidatus Moduliflexus flocculans TaxID=1499966 RepID=A0A081BRM5_9BACT|nr:acyl-[acyl-carrier-protein]--UDP-N-acetylglucosamine O-acyltransferase [Candidatus Moduliflexus flocculans]